METLTLTAVVLATAAISGAIGMGGGVVLLAVMASMLAPGLVVPLHGIVQMVTNGTRTLLLVKHVAWRIFALYIPLQLVGVVVATRFYRGDSLEWLKPAIGGFVLVYVLWSLFKPKRLMLPLWVFALAGFGGGLLTILVGATGPFLAAFFLRDDLEKEQVVATKAMIQLVGHVAKIPAFLAIGFPYGEHLGVVLPLLGAAVAGTWLGTRVLHRMEGRAFKIAFRAVLAILGLRLLASPWL